MCPLGSLWSGWAVEVRGLMFPAWVGVHLSLAAGYRLVKTPGGRWAAGAAETACPRCISSCVEVHVAGERACPPGPGDRPAAEDLLRNTVGAIGCPDCRAVRPAVGSGRVSLRRSPAFGTVSGPAFVGSGHAWWGSPSPSAPRE